MGLVSKTNMAPAVPPASEEDTENGEGMKSRDSDNSGNVDIRDLSHVAKSVARSYLANKSVVPSYHDDDDLINAEDDWYNDLIERR